MALTKSATTAAPAVVEDGPYQRTILRALQGTSQHIYAGTVPAHVKARRRAARKVARASRRGNR